MGFESNISPLHLTREEVPIKIELIGNTANEYRYKNACL